VRKIQSFLLMLQQVVYIVSSVLIQNLHHDHNPFILNMVLCCILTGLQTLTHQLFDDAVRSSGSIVSNVWIVNNELERKCKEVVVA
jgi:hypothetical protein